jgi:hypothetical protein
VGAISERNHAPGHNGGHGGQIFVGLQQWSANTALPDDGCRLRTMINAEAACGNQKMRTPVRKFNVERVKVSERLSSVGYVDLVADTF